MTRSKDIPVRRISEPAHEPALQGVFTIRDLPALTSESEMVQPLHRHDFYFLLYLEEGSGMHEIDFKHLDVQDHSLFLMRPSQVHKLKLGRNTRGFLLQFKPAFLGGRTDVLNRLAQKVHSVNNVRLSAPQRQMLSPLLQSVFREFSERAEGYMDVIRASLLIFYVELGRITGAIHSSAPGKVSYEEEKLSEFMELLEKNKYGKRQVTEYADILKLSTYQLNRITKKLTGKTASDLICSQLVLEARRLLLATPAQVTQIAYTLGFQDVAYFVRFFKLHTGVSPEVFRTNFK